MKDVEPAPLARRMWTLLEPIHAVLYFTEEAAAQARSAGLKGFWMAYFAYRFAPMGTVGPAVATAVSYGFAPSRAERALPDAWSHVTVAAALRSRVAGATGGLRRILADTAGDAGLTELEAAAELTWSAAQQADIGGRVLAAANQALPRPGDPLAALWQAATTLREHRGDGHNAVLTAAGIDPVQAHWLKIGAEETNPETLRTSRAWDEPRWLAGRVDLQARGWLNEAGLLTAQGRKVHVDVERQTDAAAMAPWTALGAEDSERLARCLLPISAAVVDSGALPFPNPIGLRWSNP